MHHALVREAAIRDRQRDRSRGLLPISEDIRGLKTIILEDHPILLNDTASFLRKSGLVELTDKQIATDLDEAIGILKREQPEVVITDLSLTPGGKEGFEILKEARKMGGMLVILSTSLYVMNSQDTVNRQIREANFDIVINKNSFLLVGLPRFPRSKNCPVRLQERALLELNALTMLLETRVEELRAW